MELPSSPVFRRAPGRPLLQSPEAVLAAIRALAGRGALVRVHRDHPALYARARRLFGSWGRALSAAGLDRASVLAEARARALERRRDRPGAIPAP